MPSARPVATGQPDVAFPSRGVVAVRQSADEFVDQGMEHFDPADGRIRHVLWSGPRRMQPKGRVAAPSCNTAMLCSGCGRGAYYDRGGAGAAGRAGRAWST
jgi:hypothetical protein